MTPIIQANTLRIPPDWQNWPDVNKRQFLEKLTKELERRTGRKAADILQEQKQGQSQNIQVQRKAFVDRYYTRPDLFAEECITWPEGKSATPYQLDGMRALVVHHRHALRGPRGLGKTAIAAIIIIWFSLTRSIAGHDWKCVSTANYWRQLQKFLWPEVHKWVGRVKWNGKVPREPLRPTSEMLGLSIRLPHGEAFPVASDDPESMEGAHADQVLYVFDESKIIPSPSWDSVEGAFANAWGPDGREAYWLATSIPGDAEGRFYDICRQAPGYEEWNTQQVTQAEVIAAGQMSEDWARSRLAQWGEQNELYQNHVLGEFAETSSDSLIPLAWIEAAQQRWSAYHELSGAAPIVQIGVDVGRGGDKTVLAMRTHRTVTELIRTQIADTMDTAGRVTAKLRANSRATAMIDLPGVGSGVYDRVREDYPKQTIAFVPSGKTDFLDRTGEFGFPNKRCAALWNLRELLDPQFKENVALPPDELLTGDLTNFRYRYISGGKIQVESKRTAFDEGEQTLVQRLGHSPDDGDAVVMAFWEEPDTTPKGVQRRLVLG